MQRIKNPVRLLKSYAEYKHGNYSHKRLGDLLRKARTASPAQPDDALKSQKEKGFSPAHISQLLRPEHFLYDGNSIKIGKNRRLPIDVLNHALREISKGAYVNIIGEGDKIEAAISNAETKKPQSYLSGVWQLLHLGLFKKNIEKFGREREGEYDIRRSILIFTESNRDKKIGVHALGMKSEWEGYAWTNDILKLLHIHVVEPKKLALDHQKNEEMFYLLQKRDAARHSSNKADIPTLFPGIRLGTAVDAGYENPHPIFATPCVLRKLTIASEVFFQREILFDRAELKKLRKTFVGYNKFNELEQKSIMLEVFQNLTEEEKYVQEQYLHIEAVLNILTKKSNIVELPMTIPRQNFF